MKEKKFDPSTKEPYALSRRDIQLYLEDPYTFYLVHRHGVEIPQSQKSHLEITVKKLLRKELNIHRADQSKHPLMKEYGIDAIPFSHTELKQWSQDYLGLQAFHGPTNLIVGGRVDDVWHTSESALNVVEFVANLKPEAQPSVESLTESDKRRVEMYQWILKQKGHEVSPTTYFLYIYGRNDKEALDARLEFRLKLIAYQADHSWVSDELPKIKSLLESNKTPKPDPESPWYKLYSEIKAVEDSQ